MPADTSPSLARLQQQITAFSDLAHRQPWAGDDNLLHTMETLYAGINPASKAGIVLGFALAKVHDDLGNTERCFQLLKTDNRYHQRGKTDTIADARRTVAAVTDLFGSQSVTRLDQPLEERPVFILGMPRSGTTLVEQILSSHSQVLGGGELKLMGQWCYGYLKLYGRHGRAAALDNYLPQLRDHYLEGLKKLGSSPVKTDKMPVNFLWIGFILSALPSATIIHTRRNPMAVCWSIYKTAFAGTSNGYSCDLRDIGEFYLLYTGLMTFWNELFPGKIHDCHYERLTENQVAETQKLLALCGLEWEQACLDFQENPRIVRTVSKNQVRQPMYQGSSRAWKPYERYLAPLKSVLGPLADQGFPDKC